MSDPRASITRSVLAPPRTGSAQVVAPATRAPVEAVRLIGKPHGRMRCVNLSLTPDARQALYARAETECVTLGEALMSLVAHAKVATMLRRPDRAVANRRGVQTVSVYVLLTPGEAREILAKSEASRRSVSDFATSALTGS